MLILLLGLAQADRLNVTSGSLTVQAQYSLANFGFVPYGAKLQARLSHFPQAPTLCVEPGRLPQLENNHAVLALRGECTFVRKARAAQAAGASMLVVMDNVPEHREVLMVADGNTDGLHIPSVLVDMQDGAAILQLLKDDPSAKLSISFCIFERTRPEVTFFLGAGARATYLLMRQLTPVLPELSRTADTRVVYQTHGPGAEEGNCYYGQYCVYSQGKPGSGAGQRIIRQQLLQYLLFSKDSAIFLKFLNAFDLQCDQDFSQDSIAACSADTLAGITNKTFAAQLLAEVEASFGQSDNELLKAQQTIFASSGVVSTPGLTVNGVVMRGNPTSGEARVFICSGYRERPSFCRESQQHRVSPLWSLLFLPAVVGLGLLLLWGYRRCCFGELTGEMRSRIKELVTKQLIGSREREAPRSVLSMEMS